VYDNFDAKLAALNGDAMSAGVDEVRRTLETVKPKQAKQFIVEMLDRKEIDDVVTLLSGMADAKRAKIIGEFKTPGDLDKISEVLRRIREGEPSSSLSDTARKQLDQSKVTQAK
jgi:hypothetical protein